MDGGFPYGRTSGIDTGSSPGIKKRDRWARSFIYQAYFFLSTKNEDGPAASGLLYALLSFFAWFNLLICEPSFSSNSLLFALLTFSTLLIFAQKCHDLSRGLLQFPRLRESGLRPVPQGLLLRQLL